VRSIVSYVSSRCRPARPGLLGALLGLVVVGCLASCGPERAGSWSAPSPSEGCLAVGPAESAQGPRVRAPERLEVAVTGAVDASDAPAPRGADESFLFRLLYEPLVHLDCRGRRYPALASAWAKEDGGRRWVFTLRPGARFWDGTPVTARDVERSWRSVRWRGAPPREWPPQGVAAVGPRTVAVELPEPTDRVPSVLARSELAVVRRSPGEPWPVLGTGPYRVAETSTLPSGGTGRSTSGSALPIRSLVLRATEESKGLPPTIRVRVAPGEDGRDLLDGGAGLLLTGDRATLDYARRRPGLSVRRLPWNRTYVFFGSAVVPTAGSEAGLPVSFLETLARDAVPVEARAAPRSASGSEPPSSGFGPEAPGGRPPLARELGAPWIGYPAGDAVGRALAGRLVALAAAPASTRDPEVEGALRVLGLARAPRGLRAAPLDPESLAGSAALRGAGVVRALAAAPRDSGGAGCVGVLGEGPERSDEGKAGGAAGDRRAGVPLVQTRRSAILRAQGPSVAIGIDCDGTPFIVDEDR